MPPTEIDNRSRSAFSPALPTAMTMRPQLASAAAIAVLTRGELPIDRPMRRAARSFSAPVTSIVTNFSAPSPSRASCCAKSIDTAASARRKSARRGSRAFVIAAFFAWPVAQSSTVSLVEVSPSTVTQLKDLSAASLRSGCNTVAGKAASVNR